MSFFLLGKDPDGELHLISSAVHQTRQDALAELSHLTADPGFPHWDADVLVMELDSGTPILLVRPTPRADEPLAPEPSAIEDEEPAAVEVEEPQAAEDEESQAIEEEESPAAEEPVDDGLAQVLEGLSEDMPEQEGAVEPDFTDVREDASVVAADSPVADLHVEPDAEPVATHDAVETTEDAADAALREAIMRTAVQMESEGIVAPDSIGAETPGETMASRAEVPEAEEPVAAEPAIPADEVAEIEPVPADASEAEPAAGAPAWPWDTKGSEPPFSLDALEEPAHAVTPLVTAAGDDETMVVSRPMILGSYAEPPSVVGAEAEEPAPTPEIADTSDFILDLDPIAEASPSMSEAAGDFEAPQGFEAAEPASAADMSCDDCVYVQTCPNKGQRDPKTCGSFQWK